MQGWWAGRMLYNRWHCLSLIARSCQWCRWLWYPYTALTFFQRRRPRHASHVSWLRPVRNVHFVSPNLAVLDVIPTVFQVLNARVLIPTGAPKTYVTIPYTAVCYALYVLQIVLTAVSLTVIYKKSQHQHFSGNTVSYLFTFKHVRVYYIIISEGRGKSQIKANSAFRDRAMHCSNTLCLQHCCTGHDTSISNEVIKPTFEQNTTR